MNTTSSGDNTTTSINTTCPYEPYYPYEPWPYYPYEPYYNPYQPYYNSIPIQYVPIDNSKVEKEIK